MAIRLSICWRFMITVQESSSSRKFKNVIVRFCQFKRRHVDEKSIPTARLNVKHFKNYVSFIFWITINTALPNTGLKSIFHKCNWVFSVNKAHRNVILKKDIMPLVFYNVGLVVKSIKNIVLFVFETTNSHYNFFKSIHLCLWIELADTHSWMESHQNWCHNMKINKTGFIKRFKLTRY